MRIEGREYKEQSKSRKSKRKQREREQRECRDRWRVRTKRAEKIVSRIFLCFFTRLLYLLSNAMNCQTNKYEAHGWMITVYQHDYSYGKSKIPKHKAVRKKESINRVERRERAQSKSIETEKERAEKG